MDILTYGQINIRFFLYIYLGYGIFLFKKRIKIFYELRKYQTMQIAAV